MIMHDCNKDRKKVVLLIHPMLASSEVMKETLAKYMGNEYRFLIPDMSSHGDDAKSTYKSAAAEARAIAKYIKEMNIPSVSLGFGASLGATVLLELLKLQQVPFGHIFFEGAIFCEYDVLVRETVKMMALQKHKNAATDIDRYYEKLKTKYGEKTAEIMARQFVTMNEDSIKNIINDCADIVLPKMSENLQKKCTLAYGEKDINLKRVKKIRDEKYPFVQMRVWGKMDHCQRITYDPKGYANVLIPYIK